MSEKNSYVIRESSLESDASDSHAIFQDCLETLCPNSYSRVQIQVWKEHRSLDYYKELLTDRNTVFLVVRMSDSDKVIGFGSFTKCEPEKFSKEVDIEILKCYVSPRHTGRGVGKMLLAELERRAIEMGGSGFGLESTPNAVPFYKARGYVVKKEEENVLGNTPMKHLLMEKYTLPENPS